MIDKTKDISIVPKKLDSLIFKKVNLDYEIVNSNKEVVGLLYAPKQYKTYFDPNWSVWKGNTLIECFASLEPALTLILKTFTTKKKKKS